VNHEAFSIPDWSGIHDRNRSLALHGVGTRTIAAIRLDLDHDPTWYGGPPYGIVEHVFDEDGMVDCRPAPRQRTYDDSGRSRIVTVKFRPKQRARARA
jgi:hypothetical protein